MKMLLVRIVSNMTIRHCLVRKCINRSDPGPYLRGGHGSSVLHVVITRQRNIIDLYETVLRPYGINSAMGAGSHPTFRYTPRLIDELLA